MQFNPYQPDQNVDVSVNMGTTYYQVAPPNFSQQPVEYYGMPDNQMYSSYSGMQMYHNTPIPQDIQTFYGGDPYSGGQRSYRGQNRGRGRGRGQGRGANRSGVQNLMDISGLSYEGVGQVHQGSVTADSSQGCSENSQAHVADAHSKNGSIRGQRSNQRQRGARPKQQHHQQQEQQQQQQQPYQRQHQKYPPHQRGRGYGRYQSEKPSGSFNQQGESGQESGQGQQRSMQGDNYRGSHRFPERRSNSGRNRPQEKMRDGGQNDKGESNYRPKRGTVRNGGSAETAKPKSDVDDAARLLKGLQTGSHEKNGAQDAKPTMQSKKSTGPRNQGSAGRRGSEQRGRSSRYQGGRVNQAAAEDDESQRGLLSEQLSNGSYECMVCCDVVRCEAAIWSCNNCYHVYHLRCVKKWALSLIKESPAGWRCPACQNMNEKVPMHYRCFCGKVKSPDWNRYDTPHSCGEICRKKRQELCIHPCNILCHPGPCPPCHAQVTKTCRCGREQRTVKCGQSIEVKCEKSCDRTLNCGKHTCHVTCHSAPCEPCTVTVTQSCYCGKESREVICGSEESKTERYCCQVICRRVLSCGNHTCEKSCHQGACETCPLLPELVSRCPCGKTALSELEGENTRASCLDPIATCTNVCGKELPCGTKDSPHTCSKICHQGECGACEGKTQLICRCGLNIRTMPCSAAAQYTESSPFLCEKKCNKKRTCGRHKCGQKCCIESEHPCDQLCGRKLSCGLHKCEEPCHRNNCPTCWQVSFEELSCHCGAEVLFPPIPCGHQPPECRNPCLRQHPCQHPVYHNCHSSESCPPCTVLVKKMCMGGHEMRNNIPCHLGDISCGLPCNKELPCGQHKCKTICHKDECLKEGTVCSQPCLTPKPCGHHCNAPCHVGTPCPRTTCKAQVMLKCRCGNRLEKDHCLLGSLDAQRQMASDLASSVQSGDSVDMTNFLKNSRKQRELECNEQCGIMERNRRVALALEISNPDLSGKLGTPTYTQALKDFARQNFSMMLSVEKAYEDLVKSVQQSKVPMRRHAFPSMKRDHRQMVHELGEFYGCETQGYDQEPNRNVVATAVKDKCWMPSVTLTTVIQREAGRIPMPVQLGKGKSVQNSSSTASVKSSGMTVLGAWGKPGATPPSDPAPPTSSSAAVGPPGSRQTGTTGGSTASRYSSIAKPADTIDYWDATD